VTCIDPGQKTELILSGYFVLQCGIARAKTMKYFKSKDQGLFAWLASRGCLCRISNFLEFAPVREDCFLT
jgi:hypothetical protein